MFVPLVACAADHYQHEMTDSTRNTRALAKHVDTSFVSHLGRPLATLRSRIQLLVGALLVLLLVSAAGTLLVQRQVTATQMHLRHVLRPAQVEVARLGEAYVDQETGARGYQLTADKRFLQPYRLGITMANVLRRQLGEQLAGDRSSRQDLAAVDQAALAWQTRTAQPEVAHAQLPASRKVLLQQELMGTQLFDALRARLGHLSARINVLTAAEVSLVNSAQSTANLLTIGAGLLGVVLVFVAALMLRNSLSRPLTTLVAQVQRVADGELGHSVDVAGPAELSTVARAVETMRVRILAQTARAMEMQRQLDLTEESERIAGGLQDLVIRRLSGTGLVLQSTASRYPPAAKAMFGAVDEIDKAIRELRAVVFGLTAGRATGGLRKRVLNLVSESEPSLGFTPQLQFDGILNAGVTGTVSDELISALREMLSNIARHPQASEAEVRLNVTNGVLRLRVADNRQPPPGEQTEAKIILTGLSERAERLGGTCSAGRRPGGGTTIEWEVPAHGGTDQEPVGEER